MVLIQNNSAIIDVIDINQGEKIGSSGSIDIYEKDDSQGFSEEPNVHLKGVIDINQGEKIGSSGSIDIYEKDDSQGLSEEPNVHLKGLPINVW
ncbi:9773_t:CDS:2 [Entrophospora sp. SA101]|nr:9773_t:CDS:2 [Entrophospora sp. SA101]